MNYVSFKICLPLSICRRRGQGLFLGIWFAYNIFCCNKAINMQRQSKTKNRANNTEHKATIICHNHNFGRCQDDVRVCVVESKEKLSGRQATRQKTNKTGKLRRQKLWSWWERIMASQSFVGPESFVLVFIEVEDGLGNNVHEKLIQILRGN